MKYLQLVWAALARRKTRTVLTILSVLVAFLLFGLLDGVRAAFNAGGTLAGVDRMVVSSRFSIIQPLPESLVARVRATPGVRRTTWANWFAARPGAVVGMYQNRVSAPSHRASLHNMPGGATARPAGLKSLLGHAGSPP